MKRRLREFDLNSQEVSQREKLLVSDMKKYNDIAFDYVQKVKAIIEKLYEGTDPRNEFEPFLSQLLEDYEDVIIPGITEGISPEGYCVDKFYDIIWNKRNFRESKNQLSESKVTLPIKIHSANVLSLKRDIEQFFQDIRFNEPFELQNLESIIETLIILRDNAIPTEFESVTISGYLRSVGLSKNFISEVEKLYEGSNFNAPLDEFLNVKFDRFGQKVLGKVYYMMKTSYGEPNNIINPACTEKQKYFNIIDRMKFKYKLDRHYFDFGSNLKW